MKYQIIPAVGDGFLALNPYGACLGQYATKREAENAIKRTQRLAKIERARGYTLDRALWT